MKCPVCGSEITTGVKYCPVCGTDVESALQRAQQAAPQAVNVQQRASQAQPQADPYAEPAERAPRDAYGQEGAYQQAGGYQQQPLHSPQPQQGRAGAQRGSAQGRGFDTKSMKPAPKWPIVLIIVLVVVIVAALLAILKPWESGSEDGGSQTSATTASQTSGTSASGAASDGAEAQPSVSDGAASSTAAPAASAGLDDASAFAQLTAVYDQFAGFEARVQSIVDYFNTAYPSGTGSDAATVQSWLSTAQALLADLSAQASTLGAIQLADGSAYTQTLANLATLNNDLVVRTQDLADALQAWLAGDADSVSAALTRHNDGGVSVYKTEYEALYPVARPVQA